MKHVSLRDFNNHPSKYLKKLPLVLTQYNKPVAILIQQTSVTASIEPAKLLQEPNLVIASKAQMEIANTMSAPQVIPGKTAQCPKCDEVVPIQFANKHYMDKHEI
jgi:hypothetical protein